MHGVMDRLLPWPVAGALAGFVLGFMTWISLGLFGLTSEGSGFGPILLGLAGAICGYVLGVWGRQPEGRIVVRWCVGTMVVVGGVSFLAGFVGPMILRPDSPQGPLLGLFFTGPLGAVAGAILGLIIGLVRQGRPA